MLEVVIVGIGAMGCLFASYLAPHANVTMLGHWPEQLRTLQRGLTLIKPDKEQLRVDVKITGDASSITPVAFVLVLVKSYQTRQAAQEMSAFLRDYGYAITLQNGLGNDQALASQLGANRVVLGSTTEGATLIETGMVRHAGQGETVLQDVGRNGSERLREFTNLLRQAGFRTNLASNVSGLVWEKLVVNAAINPLTALLNVNNGFLLSSPPARRIARRAAVEAALVARAAGHDVAPDSASEHAETVARHTKDNLSSMLQDVRNGRPTELEAITGAVLHFGQANNVPTPVNSALYDLLAAKLRGENWTRRIESLAPDLQPLFALLYQEISDESP